jgi:hypothetical protein
MRLLKNPATFWAIVIAMLFIFGWLTLLWYAMENQ